MLLTCKLPRQTRTPLADQLRAGTTVLTYIPLGHAVCVAKWGESKDIILYRLEINPPPFFCSASPSAYVAVSLGEFYVILPGLSPATQTYLVWFKSTYHNWSTKHGGFI